ncbi:hypothetical protein MP638_004270 [Amoeboaphelidium occidentale]|nr:hypothetical protein MP638_004270 [Amoeboaphelidium occidentale]
MNLDFENLVSFQKSSSLDLATTSDVSFYCSFFAKHYGYNAIDKLYLHHDEIINGKNVSFYCSFFAKHYGYNAIDKFYLYQGEIINGKSVAERFVGNNYIFAEFFYYNAQRNKYHYALMTRLNICSVPPEVLRIIAMNLDFENLVSFQKSSSLDLATTSDVSFYCSFFAKHYGYNAIDKFYLYQGEIINGKSVAERFLKRPELYFEPSNEFELERLGCEIGDAFASASNDIWTPSVLTTMASLRETVSKLRHENPGLVKAKQWRLFED